VEILQNLSPIARVFGTTPVALVHYDQVEEVGAVFLIEARPVCVLGDRLVSGKVDLAALLGVTVGDLPTRIAENGESLVLGIVYENVPVREIEDSWSPVLAGTVPRRIPKLPADLEGDDRFTGSRRHR
jgi:hypothetical protein